MIRRNPTIRFEDIQWPDDLILPWMATYDELPADGDESDDPIIRRYGVPVFFTKPDSNGTCYVKGINEAYWAALYADENIVLHEPDERTFFHFDIETGAYSVIVQAYANYCPERGWDPMPESHINRQLPSLMLEMFQSVRCNDCSRNGKAARGYRRVMLTNPDLLP